VVSTLVVDVRSDPYDVYVGRANPRHHLARSTWHNPFRIGADGTREEVLDKYREYLLGRPDLLAQLGELRGRVLGCWCAPPGGLCADDPVICHGQILATLAGAIGPLEGSHERQVALDERGMFRGTLAP
jgi:hypothetical protein